jgi:hypothetical protein
LRAWESGTGPEAQAQIDASAVKVDIAAHHAPRRLELQRKLESCFMLRTGTPSVTDRAWYPPDVAEPWHKAHARARIQARTISPAR